jgi:methyl-accepting chemotaxis protein
MMPPRRTGIRNPEFIENLCLSPGLSILAHSPLGIGRPGMKREAKFMSARRLASCVWTGNNVVEAAKQAGKDRQEGGSLNGRLRFAGLDAAGAATMREHRNLLLPHLKNALRDLFHRFQSYPDASRNFQSEAQLERLHDLHRSHWEVLTDARFDALYAERVRALADAERRMGIDPRWHIAGHAVVLEHLVSGLIDEFWPKSMFANAASRKAKLAEVVTAVLRTALVDLEIAVSLRFNESRMSHQQALTDVRDAQRAETRTLLSAVAECLAAKDFSGTLGIGPSDHGDLFDSLNSALADVQAALSATSEKSESARAATGRLSLSAAAIADGVGRSSHSLAATATELEEIAAKAGRGAASARNAEAATIKARQAAVASGEIVSEAITAMSGIEQSAEKIGQIIGVIDEIAFQTNLLALNAGIEAARAGESGRGFAVVAQEVRALAQRSADPAREIKQLVTGTKTQVDSGVQMVARTQDAIGDIVTQVSGINETIVTLAAETAGTAADIAATARASATVSQELAETVGRATEARDEADRLQSVILELGNTIREFRLERRQERPVSRMPESQSVAVIEPLQDDFDDFEAALGSPVLLAGRAVG